MISRILSFCLGVFGLTTESTESTETTETTESAENTEALETTEPGELAESIANIQVSSHRLPSDVLPSSYNLTIKPYLTPEDGPRQFTFDGEIFINVASVSAKTKTIVLHSLDLNFTLMEYWDFAQPDQRMEFLSHDQDKETDKLILHLKEDMIPEKMYTLHFSYTGKMADDFLGFYRNSYVDENNATRWFGATEFEPFSARRAFPCFDEPKFLAEFQITIIRRESFKTLSNTRIMSTKRLDENNFYADMYEKTPKMPTYVFGWMIFDDFVENSNSDQSFSVVARSQKAGMTNYSLDVGQKVLEDINNYLCMPYDSLGITKMHLVALPGATAFGAAEVWGLITFRESILLLNKEADMREMLVCAKMISHEISHIWFGNLVAIDWWSYKWMKEGLATYFECILSAKFFPELNMENEFFFDRLHESLSTDSSFSTRPLSDTTVETKKDIKRMGDFLIYEKGASVFRMIRYAMGENNFRAALRGYLEEFKYQAVTPDALFKHLECNWPKETKEYSKGLFDSYTVQPGYPLVTITVSSDGKSMEIKQKRFLTNAPPSPDPDPLLYTIPLTFTTNEEMNFDSPTEPIKIYLDPKDDVPKTINLEKSVDWVIANIKQTGYYRVNYNEENWLKIGKSLLKEDWGGIPIADRAYFVSNLAELAKTNEISHSLALQCLEYLRTEIDTALFRMVQVLFSEYKRRLLGSAEYSKMFDNYVQLHMNRVYKHTTSLSAMSAKGTDKFDYVVIFMSCIYGMPECISKCLEIFESRKTKPVPGNMQYTIYCAAAMEATEEVFDEILEEYQNIDSNDENGKTKLLVGLGRLKTKALVEKYFNIIMNEEGIIAKKDKKMALQHLLTDAVAEKVELLFGLMTRNHEKLAQLFDSYDTVGYLIYYLSAYFNTEEQLNELRSFNDREGEKFGPDRYLLESAANSVKKNIEWNSKHLPGMIKYLSCNMV